MNTSQIHAFESRAICCSATMHKQGQQSATNNAGQRKGARLPPIWMVFLHQRFQDTGSIQDRTLVCAVFLFMRVCVFQ